MKKITKNQTARIFLEVFIGIIISFILNFILIKYGYFKMSNSKLTSYTVSLLSIPIYKITRTSLNLNGYPMNSNMVIIGIIFSLICVSLGELFFLRKEKRNGQ